MLSFTSFEFVVFFAVLLILYYVLPYRIRTYFLLIASFLYYFIAARWAVVYLLLSIIVTYYLARLLEYKKNRYLLTISISIVVLTLLGFKFLTVYSSRVESLIHISFDNLFVPLGISFLSFKMISYLIDVYNDKFFNHSFHDYAIYVSFFPQVVSGPIARFVEFRDDLDKNTRSKNFNYEGFRSGLILILWGFFMKLVIADRLAIFVNEILPKYQVYGFAEICIAIILYAFEIYCDFAGYSNIANGCSMVLGFKPVANFKYPYFSKTFKEFWRRWHISLSTWFKDYIYIPLGGNRVSTIRTCTNIMIIMLISGIWHGVGSGFIVWGILHGIIQVIEIYIKKKEEPKLFSQKLLLVIKNFVILCIAWIFFYTGSLKEGLLIIRQCFICFNPWAFFDGTLANYGLSNLEWNIVVISLLILLVADYQCYKKDVRFDQLITKEMTWFYWLVIILLFVAVFVFGIYGPYFNSGAFIYMSF